MLVSVERHKWRIRGAGERYARLACIREQQDASNGKLAAAHGQQQASGSTRAATENEPHSTARFPLLIPIRAAPLGMAYSKGGGGGGMSAVDAILAEAADLVALEQIARLNTAHLGDGDSALPSSLESRFRKLKSLPAAAAVPPVRTLDRSATAPTQHHADRADPPAPAPAPAAQEHRPEGGEAAQTKESSPTQVHPPATAIPAVQEEEEDLERLFRSGARGRPTLKERNRGRNTDSTSPPPRQACCFGFSPKKPPQRSPTRSKKSHAGGGGPLDDILGIGDADEWDDENRRIVTELKEQQRKLKKGLEEQVKVSRETAKMARWVKQASARMTHTAAIDDLLSDIDDDEELK